MSKENPKFDLNIYLLKDTVDDHKIAINNISKLKAEVLKHGTKAFGLVYTKRPYSNPPRWAKFFRDYIDPAVFGKNASTAALLARQVKRDRVVCVLPAGGCVPGGIYRLGGGLGGVPISAAARRYAVFQQKERHVVVAATARVPVHGC